MKEEKWDNKRMTKLDNFKISLRTKEEKVWWTKRKFVNYRPFLNPKSKSLMNSTTSSMIFREKAKKTMRKSNSWETKSKKKEEKAQLTKIQLKNWNTFWLKRWDFCKTKIAEPQTLRMTLKVWETSFRAKGKRVWSMSQQ